MELTKREAQVCRNLVTQRIALCKDEMLLYRSSERKELMNEQIVELETLRNKLGSEVDTLSKRSKKNQNINDPVPGQLSFNDLEDDKNEN